MNAASLTQCEYVEWRDAYGVSASWQEIKDVKPTVLVCNSIGWVIAETEDCITIVPHVSEANHEHAEYQGCGDMTIPKTAIVRRVRIDLPQSEAMDKLRVAK